MSNYRPSFLSSIPPVVKNLIGINIVLFLASIVMPTIFSRLGLNVDLNDILGMHYWESSKFNPAQLVTYAFMHGGFMHIFFNMFALYMFGGVLEHVWGTKRFLIYYLVTAIGAGIIQQIFWTVEFHSALTAINQAISSDALNAPSLIEQKRLFLDSPNFITIGASGSVFGLLLAFGWLFPEERLFLMFIPVPIKARIFVFIYGVVELFQGVANFSGDNVAHFAHLGGMLFGAILILIWKRKKRY
ncbi:MAG TPA: rhomboid family intramembrane serine protease [Paludibacter sp.]|nr:rhomboid family intramembrane serine protease [Paludibacter sp.]